MNTTVVVCSANRPDVLSETIESLRHGQSLQPAEIIVSVFNPAHVPEKIRTDPGVRVVVSSRQALSAQRNAAIKVVRTPYTLFLDDDVEITITGDGSDAEQKRQKILLDHYEEETGGS